MQTITVELINENALKLLQQLEKLNILRLKTGKSTKHIIKQPGRKWPGSISKDSARNMLAQLDQNRNGWDRNT